MVCNFYSKLKTRLPFSQADCVRNIKQAIKTLKITDKIELSVILVGDRKIKTLNKKFRHKDKVTDVLSFSQQEGQIIALPAKTVKYLGEIVISYPQLKRQAKKFRQSLKQEFDLLLIHGFLHLLGYDDQADADYRQMKEMEDKILAKL